jgi:hypothetical protein
MSDDSSASKTASKDRLPFEPGGGRKKKMDKSAETPSGAGGSGTGGSGTANGAAKSETAKSGAAKSGAAKSGAAKSQPAKVQGDGGERRKAQSSERVQQQLQTVRDLQKRRNARQAGLSGNDSPATLQESRIPDAVGKRMIRRIVFLSGIPSAMGMLTFVAAYLIVMNKVFELPNAAVLLTSLGFFGLGVLGLSYGVLSASWDEDRDGSIVGFDEFGVNWQRMTQATKEAKLAKAEARELAKNKAAEKSGLDIADDSGGPKR